MSEQWNPTPKVIIQHFNPAWFASVMGTAVIPLALSFTGLSWLRSVSVASLILTILIFLYITADFGGQVHHISRQCQKGPEPSSCSQFLSDTSDIIDLALTQPDAIPDLVLQ